MLVPKENNPLVPSQLIDFVFDHVGDKYSALKDSDDYQQVIFLALIASVDFLVNCGHMEVLQTRWSTIKRDVQLSSRHWKYEPPPTEISFYPHELLFWRQKEYENGNSALEERIEKLGMYVLDEQEDVSGLAYVKQFLSANEVQNCHRWSGTCEVVLWATIMWTISDSGWDFLLEPTGVSSKPRSVIAWGMSCLNNPNTGEPWGVSVTLSSPTTTAVDVNDDTSNEVLAWNTLLFPEHLDDQGDEVKCSNCGVYAHCVKRVQLHVETKDLSIILCDHCREDALYSGLITDSDQHVPEEEGGSGAYRTYDCLRKGDYLRPYCTGTDPEDCRHNDQSHMLRILETEVQHKTQHRQSQLADGSHELIGVLQNPEMLHKLIGT